MGSTIPHFCFEKNQLFQQDMSIINDRHGNVRDQNQMCTHKARLFENKVVAVLSMGINL